MATRVVRPTRRGGGEQDTPRPSRRAGGAGQDRLLFPRPRQRLQPQREQRARNRTGVQGTGEAEHPGLDEPVGLLGPVRHGTAHRGRLLRGGHLHRRRHPRPTGPPVRSAFRRSVRHRVAAPTEAVARQIRPFLQAGQGQGQPSERVVPPVRRRGPARDPRLLRHGHAPEYQFVHETGPELLGGVAGERHGQLLRPPAGGQQRGGVAVSLAVGGLGRGDQTQRLRDVPRACRGGQQPQQMTEDAPVLPQRLRVAVRPGESHA